MPRPTKYDAARAATICRSLEIGCTRKASAEAACISFDTFSNWMKSNPVFSALVTRAEAQAENAMVACLQTAAITDWRAAESWLKRRSRDEWGDNEKVTHGGSFEVIAAGAAEADAKFAAAVARSRPDPVLE